MKASLTAIAVAGAVLVSSPVFAKYYIYKPAPQLVVAPAKAPVALTAVASVEDMTGGFGTTQSSVVTITNPNTVATNLGSIVADGVTIDTAASTCGTTLAANASCTVKVNGTVGMTDSTGTLTFGNSLKGGTQVVNFTIKYVDPFAGNVVFMKNFDAQSDAWAGTKQYQAGYGGTGFAPYFYTSSVYSSDNINLGSGQWTVEAHIKPVENWGGQIVGYHVNGVGCDWMMFLNASRMLSFHIGNSLSISSGAVIPVGTWTHVAVTRNATGTLKFFVNGTQVSTYTYGQGIPAPSNGRRLAIGNDSNNGPFNFKGNIDNVRITLGADRSNNTTTIPTIIR